MMRRFKNIIWMILLLMAASIAPAAAYQAQPPYPTEYWINGVVDLGTTELTSVDSFEVVYYKQSGIPSSGFAYGYTDISGNYRVNLMDDFRMTTIEANAIFFVGIVKKNGCGLNERIVTIEAADAVNGYKNIDLTLLSGEGIDDPNGPSKGPIINVSSVMLEAYFHKDTGQMSWPAHYFVHGVETAVTYPRPTIIIEARMSTNGGPSGATTLVGKTTEITLDADGIGTNDGWWNPAPAPEQDYYLVINQKMGAAEGVTHLPVITSTPVRLSMGAPYALNLSDVTAGPIALYRDSGVTNAKDSFIDVTTTSPSPKEFRVIRNGDLNGNKIMEAADFSSTFIGTYNLWLSSTNNGNDPLAAENPNPLMPFAIADCDGNGEVTAADFTSYWLGEYNQYLPPVGSPHSYVPNLIP